ncbi:MAG: hypothetical protein RL434_940 [Pseudomonadota bacterium]
MPHPPCPEWRGETANEYYTGTQSPAAKSESPVSSTDAMTPLERRTAFALSAALFLRMMGLFMVLPVLALYADELPGATPLLVGLALGLYGFSQAALQIPFGRWSDRAGRKPVIAFGLAIFSLGGLVAAFAGHIVTVIIGRTLQGAGAVSGATLALAADLTRPDQRTKTMAIIGISIGAAFSLAFVLGPVIDAAFGLRGVFLTAAVAGVGAMLLVIFAVPTPPPPQAIVITPASETSHHLRALYFGVLFLHLVLASSFVSIPLVLVQDLALPKAEHYTLYLPALLLSLVIIGPLLGRSHRKGIDARFFPVSIGFMVAAELMLWLLPATFGGVLLSLTLFFAGFNFLEAILPSMISRAAPASSKGVALGTYATGQFAGTFLGGLTGGVAASLFGTHGVFGAAALLSLLWLVLSQQGLLALAAPAES